MMAVRAYSCSSVNDSSRESERLFLGGSAQLHWTSIEPHRMNLPHNTHTNLSSNQLTLE